MGRYRKMGLLNEGSEIVIVREDLCKELGLKVNKKKRMIMQTANGGKERDAGICGVFGIGSGRSKDVCIYFCGTDNTVLVIVGKAMAKGSKVGEN